MPSPFRGPAQPPEMTDGSRCWIITAPAGKVPSIVSHSPSPSSLILTRPDDWHLHLRDGPAMASVLPASARQFARALIMPNLKLPVATTAQAQAYRARIVAALPAGVEFNPLMAVYLTDHTDPA